MMLTSFYCNICSNFTKDHVILFSVLFSKFFNSYCCMHWHGSCTKAFLCSFWNLYLNYLCLSVRIIMNGSAKSIGFYYDVYQILLVCTCGEQIKGNLA